MSAYRALTRVRCAGQARAYHSYEHDRTPPYTDAENAILAAAITHVPTQGFTTTALVNGARDAGYLDVSANLLPAGGFSLIKYHLVTQRLALGKDDPPHSAEEPKNVLRNVRALSLKRLRANEPIIHRWQEVSSRQESSMFEQAFG